MIFPHQVNYITTGELGNFEILLMCYDDGDVIAYYTHQIAQSIQRSTAAQHGGSSVPASRMAVPRPFFHENVGRSAWGLAIHKQSRLLAVSCNKHDVTVFAFATESWDAELKTGSPGESPSYKDSPKLWSGQTAAELERHVRSRTRTWRIVLPLDRSGNNIPSIAFLDDEYGDADKVVAVDIVGHTYILDIWRIGTFPIAYSPCDSRGVDQQR